MPRYRNQLDDERDYPREERFRNESGSSYDDPYTRRQFESERQRDYSRGDFGRGDYGRSEYGRTDYSRGDYNRGRFGERAEYENDEPRYSQQGDRFRDENRRSTLDQFRGDLSQRSQRDYYASDRSRLRCRDIMTKELAVATRDTPLTQVALMMKQEDTGVIPVVEYDVMGGNGKMSDPDRQYDTRNYSRGKLVGLITDRDIVVRGVAEGKEMTTARAEDIMSVDIHTARPNDRVVDVIKKMGDKQVRRIPVVNENKYLVGMISMADVAVETREDRELSEALEDISKGSSFWNRIFG